MNAAERRVEEAHALIASARHHLHNAEQELQDALSALHGIKIGDRVRSTTKPIAGSVRKISWWTSSPWVSILADNKDGTPGKNVRHLYGDWERIA